MDVEARRRWMSVLARASADAVESAWRALGNPPAYRLLRGPDTGLVMVRARAGGTGARFNLGEMTVTRCSVELGDGTVGHAWVGGRSRRHAELAAVFDALLQDSTRQSALITSVVQPLDAAQAARRETVARKAESSRVEFFTMVRGEG